MTRRIKRVYGPPGTGKTTYCLDEVQGALESGIEPQRIAYVTFTKAGANEARDRAISRFGGLEPADFCNFRTLHSMSFRRSKLKAGEVMSHKNWLEFSDAVGMTFTGVYNIETERVPTPWERGIGDRCLRILGMAKARRVTIEQQCCDERAEDTTPDMVARFQQQLEDYKKQRGLIDFIDMMDIDHEPLDVDKMIIDEAQDLTPQQWDYVRRLARNCQDITIAGDDDQAIYEWSGADPYGMLRWKAENVILPVSHRLTAANFEVCSNILSFISMRENKEWRPRDEAGNFTSVRDESELDLLNGTWLLLARNGYLLKGLAEEARKQGVVYFHDGKWSNQSEPVVAVVAYEKLRRNEVVSTADARLVARYVGCQAPKTGRSVHAWQDLGLTVERAPWIDAFVHMPAGDREYVRDLRRHGEPLTGPGRVIIKTVHGSKGMQADNVAIVQDVSRRCSEINDQELRVMYVAASRARQNTYIIRPRTLSYWRLL